MMRICALDGIIVENFLECILLLLKEDGDDQPLILQTKLILKETLMIVADSACPALSKTPVSYTHLTLPTKRIV